MQQLLAEGIRPDGILCGEDLTAAGVLKALLRAGIRVPEETAVVGYIALVDLTKVYSSVQSMTYDAFASRN